jgi:hypothetical protein
MYIWLLLIPSIPVSLIKSYRNLSYISCIGIVCALIGCMMLIGYSSKQLAIGNYPDVPLNVIEVK